MKIRLPKRSGFTLVELLVVISIIAALAAIAYPAILKFRNAATRMEAISNSGQIFMLLQDFDKSYNSYPDDSTAEEIESDPVNKKVDAGMLTGTTSNPYFRQLIATGITDAEKLFSCVVDTDSGDRYKKPDNSIANGKALQRGECAFGYIMRDKGDSVTGLTSRAKPSGVPIVVSSVKQDGNATEATYDTTAFDGEVLVLRNDKAAVYLRLDDAGNPSKELFPENAKGEDIRVNYRVLKAEL